MVAVLVVFNSSVSSVSSHCGRPTLILNIYQGLDRTGGGFTPSKQSSSYFHASCKLFMM